MATDKKIGFDEQMSFYEAFRKLARSRKKWRGAYMAVVMSDDPYIIQQHRLFHQSLHEEQYEFLNHPDFSCFYNK